MTVFHLAQSVPTAMPPETAPPGTQGVTISANQNEMVLHYHDHV